MASGLPEEQRGDVSSEFIPRDVAEQHEANIFHKWIVHSNVQAYSTDLHRHEVGTESFANPDLGGVAILVEEGDHVSLVGCRDYLYSHQDAVVTDMVLLALRRAMRPEQAREFKKDVDSGLFGNVAIVCIELPRTNYFEVHQLYHYRDDEADRVQAEVEDILMFLVSLFRSDTRFKPQGIYRSSAHCKNEGPHKSIMTTEKLKVFKSNSCWTALFESKAVFDATQSGQGLTAPKTKMLRTSLEWMTLLSGADTFVDLGGGLCLVGVFSILVPVRLLDHESLIWHLIHLKKTAVGPRSRQLLMKKFRDWVMLSESETVWYKTKEPERLVTPKHHLLGWTTEADITLGSREQKYDIRRTRAEPSAEVTGLSANAGVNLGYNSVGLNLNVGLVLGTGEKSKDFDSSSNIREWLESSTKEQVLLYNPEAFQAWVVPEIYLVLHMTIAKNQSSFGYGELPKIADPYPMLTAKLKTSNATKKVIISIMHTLGNVYPTGFRATFSRVVQGYEAYDLVHQPRHYNLKGVNISRHFLSLSERAGWHKLIPEMSAVLFFVGIDDPIVPYDSWHDGRYLRRESLFRYLPTGENYIAITIPSLTELLSRYNGEDKFDGMIAAGAYWHCEHLFDKKVSEDIKDEKHCDRLSHILDHATDIRSARRLLEKHPKGALIVRPDTGLRARWKGSV